MQVHKEQYCKVLIQTKINVALLLITALSCGMLRLLLLLHRATASRVCVIAVRFTLNDSLNSDDYVEKCTVSEKDKAMIHYNTRN